MQPADHPSLARLEAGTLIPFGGNRAARVSEALANDFQPGDHLLVVQESGALLRIPAAQKDAATAAVSCAHAAFDALRDVPDEAITRFFAVFAARLENGAVWRAIAEANARDVAAARQAGRSTTRLAVSEKMRADMVAGLHVWRKAPAARGRVLGRVVHSGWTIEQVCAPLGVVGFVFEGRPNVFADAAGVLRGGNTAVLRIGSDALSTAKAIAAHALKPAVGEAGLPAGALCLIESADRAAGWALFSDRRLALAVARGSGAAVAQLGSVARQAGLAVSLHGTGGAWIVADIAADAARFGAAVRHSLDRKVCNTLNVCCIVRAREDELTGVFLSALKDAGAARGRGCALHVVGDARVGGAHEGISIEPLAEGELGREWEWEDTPEVSLVVADDLDHAMALFNRYSPQFCACLISEDRAAQARFFAGLNAPFVGDGFTRWVDGQYALRQPELGLSNWENGRLLARGAILSGEGVFTVRSRVVQEDIDLKR